MGHHFTELQIVQDSRCLMSVLMTLTLKLIFKAIFYGNPYFSHRIRSGREILRRKCF